MLSTARCDQAELHSAGLNIKCVKHSGSKERKSCLLSSEQHHAALADLGLQSFPPATVSDLMLSHQRCSHGFGSRFSQCLSEF